MAAPTPDAHPRDRLSRDLGLSDATLLVVSGVIGSGIFLTPGRITDLLPHAGWIFAVWLAGGLLSLAGALANAELAAMFPRAGGDYVYVREAFHPLAGFLVGWLSFFAIYAGTVATLGAGLAASLGLEGGAQLAVAIGIVWAVSALNYIGVRWGALANNVTAVIKVGTLVAFAIFGPVFGAGSWENLRPAVEGTGGLSPLAFGLALSPVLFSYLGWNSSVYVASEIRDPTRNVPRSLFLGLAICSGVYLLVNATYLYALPVAELRNAPNAGEASAAALFGGVGGRLVAGFVLVSILGTLNATILVGPRIAYAMALDDLFFRGVDQAHARFHTPAAAIALQAATATLILAALRTFPSALDYTTFAILLAVMMDVAALFRLRVSRPEWPRPYLAWGHPWVPAVYFLASAAVAFALLLNRPEESILVVAGVATGVPVYLWFRRRAGN